MTSVHGCFDYSGRFFNKSFAGTDLKLPCLSPTTNSSSLAALDSTSFRKAFLKPRKTFSDNSEILVFLLFTIITLLNDYTPNIVIFHHFFQHLYHPARPQSKLQYYQLPSNYYKREYIIRSGWKYSGSTYVQ